MNALNNIVLKLCEGISCNECSFNEVDGVPGCLLIERIEDLTSAEPELVNNSTKVNRKNDELIRKQDAIDNCMKYNGQGRIWSCIMGDIEKLPSVEPKIIRCKDCKWWWQREVKINLCPGGGLLTDGEWFCGNAERINDE